MSIIKENMSTSAPVEDRVHTNPPLILIVDDDETSLLVLGGYLKRFGFAVATASGGVQALELLRQREFDLLISDLRMPGMDGITLLKEMRSGDVNIPFIVVTACGSIESAVDAMRQGAYDYLEKPFNPDNLQLTVQRALDYHRALTENRQIKAYLQECFTFQNIITVNHAMKETLEMAAKVTSFPRTTVAIYGESGTGKEVLARAIHFATTGMPTRFVAVNCAAIPEHLMESELFGHVKGAFTGAERDREGKFSQAGNGTLLLDEVGDMPLPLQAKLLRVLQERTFEKIGGSDLIPLAAGSSLPPTPTCPNGWRPAPFAKTCITALMSSLSASRRYGSGRTTSRRSVSMCMQSCSSIWENRCRESPGRRWMPFLTTIGPAMSVSCVTVWSVRRSLRPAT